MNEILALTFAFALGMVIGILLTAAAVALAQAARSHAATALRERDDFKTYVSYVCRVSDYQVAFKKFTRAKRKAKQDGSD